MLLGERPGPGTASLLAVALVALILCGAPGVAQDADERGALEIRKLQLEVAKLEGVQWPSVLAPFIGLATGAIGAGVAVYVGQRARRNALDQATHDARLEHYPGLVAATEPLAIYFPPAATLDPEACRSIGRTLSNWYFAKGGLLLSEASRNGYFRLMRALTRASLAGDLAAPRFPEDAAAISVDSVARYWTALRGSGLAVDDIESWSFGALPGAAPPLAFKDYLLLRQQSSDLRTLLSEDLHSRRRPG